MFVASRPHGISIADVTEALGVHRAITFTVRQLLVHALSGFAERACTHVGFEVVVVHAIDPEAVTFYARYGFSRFASHGLDLFMTTRTLRSSFAE